MPNLIVDRSTVVLPAEEATHNIAQGAIQGNSTRVPNSPVKDDFTQTNANYTEDGGHSLTYPKAFITEYCEAESVAQEVS